MSPLVAIHSSHNSFFSWIIRTTGIQTRVKWCKEELNFEKYLCSNTRGSVSVDLSMFFSASGQVGYELDLLIFSNWCQGRMIGWRPVKIDKELFLWPVVLSWAEIILSKESKGLKESEIYPSWKMRTRKDQPYSCHVAIFKGNRWTKRTTDWWPRNAKRKRGRPQKDGTSLRPIQSEKLG